MPSTSTSSTSSSFPITTANTAGGVTHIDLNFSMEMSKGSGSILVTDGAIQTVIDRATGLPKLRVVGATFTKEVSLDKVHVSGTHLLFDLDGLPQGATLNVYMGAGVLQSGGKPYGGMTMPGSSSFTTPAAEPPPPPGLSATIEMDGDSLRSGEEITVTITFSKQVDFNPAALSAGHAGIRADASEDNQTWIVKLTGEAATDALSNVLRLDLGAVTLRGGTERGAGIVESASYLVDTLVAAHITDLWLNHDAGPDDTDGVTNDDRIAVGGRFFGALKDGEHIELTINGRTVDASDIHVEEGYETGEYYWSYSVLHSESEERFAAGDGNTVQVRIVGAGEHHSATAAMTVTIDKDAPGIKTAPSAPDVSKEISITFDEAMYFAHHSELIPVIRLVDAKGNTSRIELGWHNLSEDGKTLTLYPDDHDLATGNTYRVYLPEYLTDLAGNAYDGPPLVITTLGDYEDKAPPRLVQAYIAGGGGTYGAGDVLEFRLRYSEQVKLTAGAELELFLSDGKVAKYVGLAGDGTEMIFTYTLGASDHGWYLDDIDHYSLIGNVQDDAGNILGHAHIEYDGLTTQDGYGAVVETDTKVDKPGTPQLHAASEASAPGENTTADTRPRLTGSGAEAGATIMLYVGALEVGSVVAGADGHWNAVVGPTLEVGAYQITVKQQDRAGNVSALSDPLLLTITAPASTLAAPALAEGSDGGVHDDDRVTDVYEPTIVGKGPAGATLTLLHNNVEIDNVLVDADGNWEYTMDPLSDGVHTFSVRQGSGPSSPALSITVDNHDPSVMDSTGSEHVDPSDDVVIIFDEAVYFAEGGGDGNILAFVDAQGNRKEVAIGNADLSDDRRTLTISAADHELAEYTSYRVVLPSTLTDLAGNQMGEYGVHFTTGNGMAPRAIQASFIGGDSYVRADETITFRIRFNEDVKKIGSSDLWLQLSNGARATYDRIDGKDVFFTYLVQSGQDHDDLEITSASTLAEGIADLSDNVLQAAHIEFGGLHNSDGYGSIITIDTVAPIALGQPSLDPTSNTGSNEDLLTSDATPTLAGGGAEAGAKVEIYKGSTLLGYGYADGSGNWKATVDRDKALASGSHSLTVKQVDRAGNAGVNSAALELTVDAVLPSALSVSDRITKEDRPVLSGSDAKPFAGIKILQNGDIVGVGTADDAGNWTAYFNAALRDGEHSFNIHQYDRVGNVSADTPFKITVDRSVPVKPGTPNLAAPSDSGIANDDNITNDTTPTISGADAEGGATIVLYAGSREIGRTTADSAGNWTLTVLEADKFTTDGTHIITAQQIDKAGNASEASDALSLTIDTAGPTLTAFSNDRDLKLFALTFNEDIIFKSDKVITLLRHDTVRREYFGSDGSNWDLVSDSGDNPVLILYIGMNGTFNLTIDSENAIVDVAGNIAHIIGTPAWTPDQTV